jgi:hypothetical protein
MDEETRYTFKVEIYTDGLLISGSFMLPFYRRVSDAINSRIRRFLSLSDATVAPLSRPQQVQRVPNLLVDWGNALLVAVLEEPEPPEGYQSPAPLRDVQPVMLFTPALAVRANFAKRPDMDLGTILDEMSDDFVALSGVQIFPLLGGAPVSRNFVCLSRAHIHALYAVAAPTPPPAPEPEPEAQPAPVAESPDEAAAEA